MQVKVVLLCWVSATEIIARLIHQYYETRTDANFPQFIIYLRKWDPLGDRDYRRVASGVVHGSFQFRRQIVGEGLTLEFVNTRI